jgi:hypothetical protein
MIISLISVAFGPGALVLILVNGQRAELVVSHLSTRQQSKWQQKFIPAASSTKQ